MIMIPAFILGAIIGAMRAKNKQGSKLDMLQYGAAHAIIFFIIAMFMSITLGWLGWV